MRHFAVIYDRESRYIESLCGYINLSKAFPFDIRHCSKMEEFRDICEELKPLLLLVGEDVLNDISDEYRDRVVVLSANQAGVYEGIHLIYKYQDADKIIKDILGAVVEMKDIGRLVCRKNRLKILSFYSPIKRSSSTTLGIILGQQLAKKHKTLYIDLETVSCIGVLLGQEADKNISDVLYYMQTHDGGFATALPSMASTVEGLDIVDSFDNQRDLIEVEADTWKELLKLIESETEYEYVLLDLSEAVRGLFELLTMSDVIYTTVEKDDISDHKMRSYELMLERLGLSEVLEKTRRCEVPYQHRDDARLSYLGFGELSEYAKNIIQDQVVGEV